MLKEVAPGFSRKVSLPVYGLQDRGIAPGGAADRFSLECALSVLGAGGDSWEAYESVVPGRWEWDEDSFAVMTGAPCKNALLCLPSGGAEPVAEGVPFFAPAGSRLNCGERIKGFRIYLTSVKKTEISDPIRRRLLPVEERYAWAEFGCIRVVRGPEAALLKDPSVFCRSYWKISVKSDHSGLRLEGIVPETDSLNMISDAVADGTVQLTPQGPIVLLHSRQTVGGYPRIYNVISADVDLLAQYMPGQIIHFREIDIGEARRINEEKKLSAVAFETE